MWSPCVGCAGMGCLFNRLIFHRPRAICMTDWKLGWLPNQPVQMDCEQSESITDSSLTASPLLGAHRSSNTTSVVLLPPWECLVRHIPPTSLFSSILWHFLLKILAWKPPLALCGKLDSPQSMPKKIIFFIYTDVQLAFI